MSLGIKKILPTTLFGRSLLILVMPVLLLQVITTFVFFDRHWDKITQRLAFAVAGEISVIVQRLERKYDPEILQFIQNDVSRALDFNIEFQEGAELDKTPSRLSGWEFLIYNTLSQALDAQVQRPYNISIDIGEKWVRVDVQLSNGVLHVDMPQRRLFSSTSYIFLLWMIGTSIVLLAIAILFMRNQIRPIRRLAIAAERFGKGLDTPRFKPEGAYEIRQAAHAFMEMRERIQRQIQQRTTMLAGVSHDLRTPLTRMKLQIAMLGESKDAKDLASDIEDMERMIDTYLDFARGEGEEASKSVNIKDLMTHVIETYKRQDVDIVVKDLSDMVLTVRPVAFERCLHNIMSNAARYADMIWISVQQKHSKLIITIEDNGPGIPEDQYEDMFRPFVRGDISRNLKSGGVGLGLPIAQDIVHAHGGEISLSKSGNGGLKVTIELPL